MGTRRLMDDQSIAEMAARLFSAPDNGGGYDATGDQSVGEMAARLLSASDSGGGDDYYGDGAGATVPLKGHPHPLAPSMSSGTIGSQTSCARRLRR